MGVDGSTPIRRPEVGEDPAAHLLATLNSRPTAEKCPIFRGSRASATDSKLGATASKLRSRKMTANLGPARAWIGWGQRGNFEIYGICLVAEASDGVLQASDQVLQASDRVLQASDRLAQLQRGCFEGSVRASL